MSVWGRRESYQAVTLVVTVCILVNGVTFALRPLIPKDENDQLSRSHSEFIKSGADQRVRWRELSQNPFLEAKQKDRPLCIVMGAPWSKYGADVDAVAFQSPLVAERLNREFIPVRIDLQTEPAWGACYLPMLRAALGSDPGFLIVTLRPNGEMLNWSTSAQQWGKLADISALSLLTEARQLNASENLSQGAQLQRGELEDLNRPKSEELPDFEGYLNRAAKWNLTSDVDVRVAGSLNPVFDWMALESRGDWSALELSVNRALGRGLFDWMDGGLYRYSADQNWNRNDFSESAVQTAIACPILARLTLRTGRPEYRHIAEKLFDALTGRFSSEVGLANYSRTLVKDNGRSFRSSLTMEDLRVNLSPAQCQVATTILKIDPTLNPLMTPRVTQWEEYFNRIESVNLVLQRLRVIRKDVRVLYGGYGATDSTAVSVAALLQTADLWEDTGRIQKAVDLFVSLSANRVGQDDVIHQPDPRLVADPYLGDYLAFAYACLVRYQVQGNRTALADGQRVLDRGLFLFKGSNGLPMNTKWAGNLGEVVPTMPAIVDNLGPSSCSLAIEVLGAYAGLAPRQEDRRRYGTLGRRMVVGLAYSANRANSGVSAYFAASQFFLKGIYWVSGPQSVAKCRALREAYPGVWIYPLMPGVWEHESEIEPGIHEIVSGAPGPVLSEAVLAARLSRNS